MVMYDSIDGNLRPRMEKFWPGKGGTAKDNKNLWDNEWREHGSCIYLYEDRLKYFSSTIDIYDSLFKNDEEKDKIDAACKVKAGTGKQDWTQCSLILSADKRSYTGVKKAS